MNRPYRIKVAATFRLRIVAPVFAGAATYLVKKNERDTKR